MAKKKITKKVVKEEKITDILEVPVMVDGEEKLEKTYMNGKKVIKKELI